MRSLPENASDALLREVRRWRLIAGGMLIVILALGSFSAYLLRSMDSDYSELLDGSLPVLNELRVLGNRALSVHRSVLAGLLAENLAARDNSVARAERLLADSGALRRTLAQREIFAEHAAAYALLVRTGETYESAATEVLAQLKQGRRAEADATRQATARPALDRYLEQIDIAARYLESHSQTVNDTYSNAARSRSTFMVALASLPIVIAAVVLTIVVSLIVVMILLFRRLGPEEGH